jgi:serine/threonine-protein kinase
MPTPPFTHLGRYRILRELGRGAMGVVYLAEDETLQRQVAIKTLLLPGTDRERAEQEARFIQEAKAAGGLSHPNVITIHDLGREGEWLYIAMELLQGTELRDRMAAGLLPLDEALDIAGQVASGLAAAHARGVVHRDVKPGNIVVLSGGLAKIMDFGVARMQSSALRTQSGTMMGSPKYMSPEQVGGHPVDHRSDIFSLGSMLYEMVTGAPAFAGNNLGQLLSAIMHGAPPSASAANPAVPASVERVIARAMQKNPAARYQDAAEMARDLAQCRASLTRATAARVAALPAEASDPFAATVVAHAATQPVPRHGEALSLAPSPHFDSSAALRRWLEEPVAATQPLPAARPPLGRIGWILAYAAAAVGAVAIALN